MTRLRPGAWAKVAAVGEQRGSAPAAEARENELNGTGSSRKKQGEVALSHRVSSWKELVCSESSKWPWLGEGP